MEMYGDRNSLCGYESRSDNRCSGLMRMKFNRDRRGYFATHEDKLAFTTTLTEIETIEYTNVHDFSLSVQKLHLP